MKPGYKLKMTPEHIRWLVETYPDGPYLIGRGADPRGPVEIEADRIARETADTEAPLTVPTAAE